MKATDVIARDHRAAEQMLEDYRGASGDDRKDIARKLFEALTRHEAMEDMYFYPALKEAAGEDPAVKQILDEQTKLKMEVLGKGAAELFTGDDEERIEAMMEDVLAHAKEEESIIFPKAEEFLGEEKLTELGEKMEEHSAVEKS
jgi:hemerythrin superfamily protein